MEVQCNGEGWDSEVAPCTSILELNKNDIVKREWSKYPDYKGTDYGFICPVCGCFSVIGDLPNNLKKIAHDYNSITALQRESLNNGKNVLSQEDFK